VDDARDDFLSRGAAVSFLPVIVAFDVFQVFDFGIILLDTKTASGDRLWTEHSPQLRHPSGATALGADGTSTS